ncbi:MAG: hypothetical protein ABWK53_10400 [Anaerolineales bacterium]
MAAQDKVDVFLKTIAGQIETLEQGVFDLSDETGFYTLATDWQEALSMVEVLEQNRNTLTQEQAKRLGELLNRLKEVMPIAKKLNLV